MHEIHEQIEHAGHGGHGEHGSSRLPQIIGITVAILGVLMALCSAQVGAARTELIATMVEESAAKARYTAVANKYRNLQAQLQQLHAAMPDQGFHKGKNEELQHLVAEVKNDDTKKGIKATGLHTDRILNTVTPTVADVERFLTLIRATHQESEAAKEWSESYRDAVKVHENTAGRFELAMLAAEIGIVIASVGLLLSRQKPFAMGTLGTAIVLGLISMSVATITKATNAQALHGAEEKIATSEKDFGNMNKDKQAFEDDEKLEKQIEEELPAIKGMWESSKAD